MFKPKTTSLNKQKQPEMIMEDYSATLDMILHGCKLARELESRLENLAREPNALSRYCDEIAKAFGGARERLRGDHDQSMQELREALQNFVNDASLHEWLRSNISCHTDQAMDMSHQDMPENKAGSVQFLTASIGPLAMDVSASGNAPSSSSSSSQRPRRRKDDAGTRIVQMAAPQMGNTEIPPEDGYTWRKYGQKEIMGSRYPRGYYRCTHQKLYNCPAKKQVQRLDHDPFTFEVMYRGHHTCHMSATAPSMFPSQAVIISQDMTQALAVSTITTTTHEPLMSHISTSTSSVPLGSWLSMDFSPALGHRTGTSSGAGTSSDQVRYNKDQTVHEFPVVDMADAMFNSGSSSTSNSMDFLFPTSVEDKRDNIKGTRKASD